MNVKVIWVEEKLLFSSDELGNCVEMFLNGYIHRTQ